MRARRARGQRRRAWARSASGLGGALVLAVSLACEVRGNPGGFEDDAGSDGAVPPDLPQWECDPRAASAPGAAEDGCPEGYKCSHVDDPELGPTNRCVERLGEQASGQPCSKIGESDDCVAGAICWASDADGTGGVCVEFCDQALLCDDEATLCSVANEGALPLCLPRCDPLAQDCAEGWGCYPDASDRWTCDRDRSGELGAHGEPCACINCCDPGLICVPGSFVDAEGCGGAAGAASCCASLCELADGEPVEGSCPTEAERCERYYPASVTVLGLEQLGVCEL